MSFSAPVLQRALIPILALLLGACASPAITATETIDSEQHRFRVVPLVEGMQHPWSLAFLPDGRMLVTERPGRLRLIADGELLGQAIAGLPDQLTASGQGGLLDVVPDPEFAANQLIYFSFAGRGEGGLGTEVARARLDLDALRLDEVEVIFRALPKSGGGRHFGSRLVFAPDGTLFITLGDRGQMDRAQQLDDHAGSLIRIHSDGRVPDDNPFVDYTEARPEIHTYGNRNMQGAALHPETGELWTHEHGPRGGDEVNVMRAGTNYGWPVISYGINYDGSVLTERTEHPDMAQPLHYWDPSIAPSGMAFYTGDVFPEWQGDLFVGALRFQLLARLELDGERIVHEERLLDGQVGRIRDVCQGPDGYLYLLTDAPDGRLLRLEPAD